LVYRNTKLAVVEAKAKELAVTRLLHDLFWRTSEARKRT
jgi:hypothetical protein